MGGKIKLNLSRFYFNRNTPKKFNGYKFQTLRLADQVWTLTRRFVIDVLDDHGVEPVEADEDEDEGHQPHEVEPVHSNVDFQLGLKTSKTETQFQNL